ncbi:MAG TPA: CPBP family intramembrane glutamic endopeptidase, partial [Anaerolineales bacterium]|nr:CPBP family intramembrane glutamic endopeptidase [Anaerolineales bacterium]
TLLVTIDRYHDFGPMRNPLEVVRGMALEGVVYYLIVPLAIVWLVFRDSPRDYGFRLGDWRLGLKLTLLIVVLVVPLVAFAARTAAMRAYYAGQPGVWPSLIPPVAVALIGWEFLFRGFLLFALVPLLGPTAILVQAVPFALAHLGKPEIETLTTILGGSLFGWVAWRTRSFLYPYLIHVAIYSLVILLTSTLPA